MPAALVTGASRRAGIAAAVVAALEGNGLDVATTGWRAYGATEPWGAHPEDAEQIGHGRFIKVDFVRLDAPVRVLEGAESAVGSLAALIVAHTDSKASGVLDTDAAACDPCPATRARLPRNALAGAIEHVREGLTR